MAVVTWTGAVSTTYSTDGNWDTGSKPTSSDDVIIANVTNDCVLTGSPTVNSLTVLSGARFNGNTETITVVGEADGSGATTNGYAVKFETGSEVVGTNTGITITTSAATNVLMQPTTGNVRDLTINHASAVVNIRNNTTLSRNLTITAGELTTTSDSHALTVTGDVDITGTLTGNASAISMGSLTINSGGTYSATSGTTTITSKNSSNYIMDLDGTFTHNNGTVRINSTGSGDQLVDLVPSSGTLYDLEINENSTNPVQYNGNTTIANDLTVVEGIFQFYDNNNSNLTVTGDVSIEDGGQLAASGWSGAGEFGSLSVASGGTYEATSGTTTITSEAGSGYAIEVSGTYTPNAGTLKITTDANTFVKILDDVNHLIIEPATATRVYEYVNNTTIQGDLTINAGRFTHYSSTYSLDVQGDCTINNTGELDGGSGSIELGSLTINSGGTYDATSGTTIITDVYSSPFALNNSGTFTHNGGTLKLTRSGNQDFLGTWTGSSALYNLTIDCGGGTQSIRANMEIEGGLIVTNGNFSTHTDNHDLTVVDLITVNGGTFTTNSSTINCGGIRNVGGTIT